MLLVVSLFVSCVCFWSTEKYWKQDFLYQDHISIHLSIYLSNISFLLQFLQTQDFIFKLTVHFSCAYP